MTDFNDLAKRIDAFEFEHVYTLHPDGSLTEPEGIWAPEVYDDPDNDIWTWTGWRALTGLTGQDSYHGAVMHPSEYIGAGIARYMQEMAEEEPVTFAHVVVTDPFAEDDEDDVVGWAIVYLLEET